VGEGQKYPLYYLLPTYYCLQTDEDQISYAFELMKIICFSFFIGKNRRISRCRSIKVKVKGKGVPVLNYVPCHEDVLGEWRYSSTHS
jgi:hypothetical protein